MFSPCRYQSIPYSQMKVATSAARSPNGGGAPQYLIWVTWPRRPEISRTPMRIGQNVIGDKAELIVPRFRGIMCRKPPPPGEKMATIPMIPVGPATTLNRSILLTERGVSGSGGDDFICGHCGHVMLEEFDPSTVRGNPVYQCGVCKNNNDLPFAASDGRHWSSR